MSDPAPVRPAPMMSRQDWLLLGLLSLIWGGSFFFAKIAVAELPPFTVVLVRVALAAAVLWALLFATGQWRRMERRLAGSFALMGFLNNLIPFSLIFWGQTQIPIGLASILNATTPVFTIIVVHLLTADEKATPNKVAGVLAGLTGVAVLMGPDLVTGGGFPLLAQLACLGAAVSYAFSGLVGRRFRDVPPLLTATGQLSATTLMMVPLVLLVDGPRLVAWPSQTVMAALLGLSVVSTAFAYVIFFRIMRSAGPTNVALVTLLAPVSAILLGALLLGEALLTRHFAGMALIGLGLLLIDGRALALARR